MKKQNIFFSIAVILLLGLIYWSTYDKPSTDPQSDNYQAYRGEREGGYNTSQTE